MTRGDVMLVRYLSTDFSSEKIRPGMVLLPEDEESYFVMVFITSILSGVHVGRSQNE